MTSGRHVVDMMLGRYMLTLTMAGASVFAETEGVEPTCKTGMVLPKKIGVESIPKLEDLGGDLIKK